MCARLACKLWLSALASGIWHLASTTSRFSKIIQGDFIQSMKFVLLEAPKRTMPASSRAGALFLTERQKYYILQAAGMLL